MVFPVHRYEDFLNLSPEPVAHRILPLIAGHLEYFAMELQPVTWLVGGGHLPHPGLEGSDVDLHQSKPLVKWNRGHGDGAGTGGRRASSCGRSAAVL